MRPLSLLLVSLGFVSATAFAQPSIVVSLQDQHLYVVENDELVADYPVVVGKPETPTPTGTFTITSITKKPTWTVPDSIMKGKTPPKARIIPPGPDNPLGAYFLRLNNSSYGIHGTTAPKLVPGSVSAGCIRMKNKDVSVLAEMVERGTRVTIIEGPYQEMASDFVVDKAEAKSNEQFEDPLESLLKNSEFLKKTQ